MAASDWPSGGRLVELTEDDCWALLGSQEVGRLAWHGPEGISVVPVNYVAAGRQIRLNTTAYSSIARECDDSPVAFEVDAVDPETRSGWSVLVRGVAHLLFDDAGSSGPDPWPAGPRPLRLRVEVRTATGRRLVADQ